MSRYVIMRRKERCDWYDDDSPMVPHLTVDDHEATDTGLITESGEPIMRLPNPIGFGRDEDW